MDKSERLAYMKKHFAARKDDELPADAVLPVNREDILEEVHELDGFREYERDLHTDQEALTSDEQ